MNAPLDPDLLDLLREARGVRPVERMPDCLDDLDLAAMVDGVLDGPVHAVALAHVATCGYCRGAVAEVATALRAPSIARELRTTAPSRRWLTVALGVAAAASAVLLVQPDTPPDRAAHRAPITAAPGPTVRWPTGRVTEVTSLRWTRVPGADRYRVTIFEAPGTVRFETETSDTVVHLPAEARPLMGGTYWWTVDARVGIERWVRSPVTEFTVAASPR